MADSRLHELSEAGVSVWIDYLSRDLVRGGEPYAGRLEKVKAMERTMANG